MVGASTWASGNHKWKGIMGILNANGRKKNQKIWFCCFWDKVNPNKSIYSKDLGSPKSYKVYIPYNKKKRTKKRI